MFIYHHVESVEKSLDTDSYKDSKQNFHSSSHTKMSKLHPAIIVKSAFPRSVYDPSLNLLAMTGQDLEVENLPIPTRNVIIVVSDFFWVLEVLGVFFWRINMPADKYRLIVNLGSLTDHLNLNNDYMS